MKKLMLMLILMIGCGGIGVRERSPVMKHMGASTVGLVIGGDDGRARVYCTGVWVGERKILTASHCVEAAARMERDRGKSESEKEIGEIFPVEPVGLGVGYVVEREVDGVDEQPLAVHLGKVIANDSDHDLALIEAVAGGLPGHDIAVVAVSLPGVGEHVYIVGHVKGLWYSYIEGVVSAYRKSLPRVGKDGPFVQISGPVYYGNSGGGAFDWDGELVGICSFMARAPQTNFFISAESIRKFLSNNL